MNFLNFRIVLTLFIIILLIYLKFYRDNYTFETKYYWLDKPYTESKNNYIKNSKFNEKVIVQISDLHNESYGKNNKDLIKAVNKLNPDYIFLTGDLVSANDNDFNGFEDLLKGISPKYKCFYVIGNHEIEIRNLKKELFERFEDLLKKYDVTFLENEKVVLEEGINLYGLTYLSEVEDGYIIEEEDIEKRLGKANPDEYNILLAHDPNEFMAYAKWGADVVYSGHVHGGMIRIFDIGIFSPTRKLFPEYTGAKIYKNVFNHTQMIVSRGLSSGKAGFRYFNTPELVVSRIIK